MNGILVRGKRIDNGEWVYGYYIGVRTMVGKTAHWILDINDKNQDVHYRSVVPSTIGRFTGMLDATGKKIFEGDIYTWKDDYGDYHACTICFGEYFDGYADRRATMANGFYVKTLNGDTFNFAGKGYSEIEISGNITDNRELMERK